MTTLAPPREARLTLELRGGNAALFAAREPEILIEGMAGTGKTRTVLELINMLCRKYDGLRVLIVRKYGVTLTTTCLVTFNEKVLHPGEVSFFGGSKDEPAAYRYPNRARIVVGGLDNSQKLLSSEYDIIYANEATELTLEDWEILTGRLRNGVLPHARIIGDCNPSHDKHWLLQRCKSLKTRRIHADITDNPEYYDGAGNVTEAGAAYLSRLDAMTGTRYQRFRLGQWVGVENAIYPQFDRAKHMGYLRPDTVWDTGALGVDYGDVHPHAVVALSRDTGGRYWVRETWCGRGYDDLVANVGRMKAQYKIGRVRVDPMLKGWEQPAESPIGGRVERADASPGSRKQRIEYVTRLLDANAVTLDWGDKGNELLAEQIEAYHWIHRQTDTVDDLVPARIDEDTVAAWEYATEALMVGADYSQPLAPTNVTYAKRPSFSGAI